MRARVVDSLIFERRTFRPMPHSPVYHALSGLPVGGRITLFDLTYEKVLDKADAIDQDG